MFGGVNGAVFIHFIVDDLFYVLVDRYDVRDAGHEAASGI
jgi:hypothetical protein